MICVGRYLQISDTPLSRTRYLCSYILENIDTDPQLQEIAAYAQATVVPTLQETVDFTAYDWSALPPITAPDCAELIIRVQQGRLVEVEGVDLDDGTEPGAQPLLTMYCQTTEALMDTIR